MARELSMTKKRLFVINYRLEGAVLVKGRTPEEAQDNFDAGFRNGIPAFIKDAEVSNDPPVEEEED